MGIKDIDGDHIGGWFFFLPMGIGLISLIIFLLSSLFKGEHVSSYPERAKIKYGYEYCPVCDGWRYLNIEQIDHNLNNGHGKKQRVQTWTGDKCYYCDGEGLVPSEATRIFIVK